MRQKKNLTPCGPRTTTSSERSATDIKVESKLQAETSKSTSSIHLVINKDMFPDNNLLNSELICDIIEEFKNQIMLARQACVNRVGTTTNPTASDPSGAVLQLPCKSPRVSNATGTPRQSAKG